MIPERSCNHPVWLGLVLFAMFLGACSFQGNDGSDLLDLSANYRLWQRQHTTTYDYVLERYCFCAFFGAYAVSVRADTVYAAIRLEDDEPVTQEALQYFPTINGLFDVVAEAIEKADRLDVEYDPTRGYPTRIDIDYLKNAIDDEIVYQAGNVQRAP
jgi:hypothetical protein